MHAARRSQWFLYAALCSLPPFGVLSVVVVTVVVCVVVVGIGVLIRGAAMMFSVLKARSGMDYVRIVVGIEVLVRVAIVLVVVVVVVC